MATESDTINTTLQSLQTQVDALNQAQKKVTGTPSMVQGSTLTSLMNIPQGAGSQLDSDTVDGINASFKPQPNCLVPLGSNNQFPMSVIPTSGGGGSGFLLGNGAPVDKHILIADGSLWQSRAVTGDISVAADTGTLNVIGVGNITNGTLTTTHGGTGQTTYTDGQLLIGDSSNSSLDKNTLTAGSNITITNGHGTITISASGGSGGLTLVSTQNPSSVSSVTFSSLSSGILYILEYDLIQNTSTGTQNIVINSDSTVANYHSIWSGNTYGSGVSSGSAGAVGYIPLHSDTAIPSGRNSSGHLRFKTVQGTNSTVILFGDTFAQFAAGNWVVSEDSGFYTGSSNLTSISFQTTAGTITGAISLYTISQ